MTIKWRHIVFGSALLGGAFAILGGRFDSPVADALSRIAVPLIMLPLAGLIVAAIWDYFSGIVRPIETGLSSAGVSGPHSRRLSVAAAIIIATAVSVMWLVHDGYRRLEQRKAACVEQFGSSLPSSALTMDRKLRDLVIDQICSDSN
jgi:hypothetical protein